MATFFKRLSFRILFISFLMGGNGTLAAADESSLTDPAARYFVIGVISSSGGDDAVEIAVLFDKKKDKSITLETGSKLPELPQFYLKQAKRREVIIGKFSDQHAQFRLKEANSNYRYAEVDRDDEKSTNNFLEKFYRKFTTGEEDRGGLQVKRFAPYGNDSARSRFDMYAPERYLRDATESDDEEYFSDYDKFRSATGGEGDYSAGSEGELEDASEYGEMPDSYDYTERVRRNSGRSSEQWLDSVSDSYQISEDEPPYYRDPSRARSRRFLNEEPDSEFENQSDDDGYSEVEDF